MSDDYSELMCYSQADVDAAVEAAVEAERAKAFDEAADYITAYSSAVRRAGYTDCANTLTGVMTSIREMAIRARAATKLTRSVCECGEYVDDHNELTTNHVPVETNKPMPCPQCGSTNLHETGNCWDCNPPPEDERR